MQKKQRRGSLADVCESCRLHSSFTTPRFGPELERWWDRPAAMKQGSYRQYWVNDGFLCDLQYTHMHKLTLSVV